MALNNVFHILLNLLPLRIEFRKVTKHFIHLSCVSGNLVRWKPYFT